MIFTIVGCGDSAKSWTPIGTSIGSNDCEKWGRGVDHLILANHPGKFKNGRLNIIKRTKAQVHTTSRRLWQQNLPCCLQLNRVVSFNTRLLNGFIYTSSTTPIMCMSLAIRMGATELILWGVDMLNHHAYYQGSKLGNREIGVYHKFFQACTAKGIKVYLGAHGTAFDKTLPLWTTVPSLPLEMTDPSS